MAHYRALAPETEKQKSPRRAAQEGVRPQIERLTGEGVAAVSPGLGPRRSKVEQLERMIKAGRVGDPLVGIEAEATDRGEPPHPHPLPRGERGLTEQGAAKSPHPNPLPHAGEGVQVSLLERVRQLYEESVVPVREIARLIGVSERTLYKYVARHGWRRRHLCLERDHAVRAANRGRTLTPRAPFAPVKGAGGRFIAHRFIAHEDRAREQPQVFASGPKALDPLAAQALAPLCAEAALASDQAIAEAAARAAAEKERKERQRAFNMNAATLERLNRTLRGICIDMAKARPEEKPKHQQLLDLVVRQMEAVVAIWRA